MMYVIKEIKERGPGVTLEIFLPDLNETFFLSLGALEFHRASEEELDRQIERVVEEREQLIKLKSDPDKNVQGMINSGESLKNRLNERSRKKHEEGVL